MASKKLQIHKVSLSVAFGAAYIYGTFAIRRSWKEAIIGGAIAFILALMVMEASRRTGIWSGE